MSKFYEKNETLCLVVLIASYVIMNSYCMQNFGFTSVYSFLINTIFSGILLTLIIIGKKTKYYGLTKVKNSKKYLYFVPLALIGTVSLWNGISIKNTPSEIIFHILTMVNVGFLEEIIFRGFLYKSMEKDNEKTAIIVSSLTFGIGHIVNLLNGADLLPTLMQICYAISLGFLFIIIFNKSKSLVPCIITHIIINSLSIFEVEPSNVILCLISFVLIIISTGYSYYISKKFAK